MAYEGIAGYYVADIAGGTTSSPTLPGPVPRAVIGLSRADHSAIGVVYFHRDPAAIPESDSLSASGHIKCNYSPEGFPRVLDLLRNEKPVYLVYMEDPWNVGYIATTRANLPLKRWASSSRLWCALFTPSCLECAGSAA